MDRIKIKLHCLRHEITKIPGIIKLASTEGAGQSISAFCPEVRLPTGEALTKLHKEKEKEVDDDDELFRTNNKNNNKRKRIK